jgi:hypothetical protein
MKKNETLQLIRRLLLAFMIILFLSGLTAITVEPELRFLLKIIPARTQTHEWIEKVLSAYKNVNNETPFLLYGYDWLAFAHFILAILFIGPYHDPVKNIWVIEFGLIACILIFPLAFIAGPFRGIPIGWRLIDCSFGLFGFLPLWICYTKTKQFTSEKNYSIK